MLQVRKINEYKNNKIKNNKSNNNDGTVILTKYRGDSTSNPLDQFIICPDFLDPDNRSITSWSCWLGILLYREQEI